MKSQVEGREPIVKINLIDIKSKEIEEPTYETKPTKRTEKEVTRWESNSEKEFIDNMSNSGSSKKIKQG